MSQKCLAHELSKILENKGQLRGLFNPQPPDCFSCSFASIPVVSVPLRAIIIWSETTDAVSHICIWSHASVNKLRGDTWHEPSKVCFCDFGKVNPNLHFRLRIWSLLLLIFDVGIHWIGPSSYSPNTSSYFSPPMFCHKYALFAYISYSSTLNQIPKHWGHGAEKTSKSKPSKGLAKSTLKTMPQALNPKKM